MIVLLYVLAGWMLAHVDSNVDSLKPLRHWRTPIQGIALIGLIGGSFATCVSFGAYYFENVREVALSQHAMADYVATTLPPDARIGVHDIGVMRYLGGHTTYDVIGLTTPSAALAWRNGPGSAFEAMRRSPWRPDYLAIYPDALGLSYFTAIYGDKLVHIPSTQPTRNIASATSSGQDVIRINWSGTVHADDPRQPYSLHAIAGMQRVDSVNVADLVDEAAHSYRWWQSVTRYGFESEVYTFNYLDCGTPDSGCRVTDGGRLLTGGESMTIHTEPGQDLVWVMRVHPHDPVTLHLFVNDQPIGVRVVPQIPGQWIEIASLVPGAQIAGDRTTLRVEANITDPNAGYYMPYYHWFYQGIFHPDQTTLESASADFGNIHLIGQALHYESRRLTVQLNWAGGSQNTDAKIFLHLYDSRGKLVAQVDQRSGNGTLPPANWLPETIHDMLTLIVPETLPTGTYQVAIGLYDPITLQRLKASGAGVGTDDRLFIGSITIP
jgi:hypothetical protein